MNVIADFFSHSKLTPSKAAIVEHGGVVSYGELASRVEALAAGMKARGIGKGSNVLILVPISAALYEVLLACFYVGATAVFLDIWSTRKRVNIALKAASPDAFVGTLAARFLLVGSSAFHSIPIKWTVGKRLFSVRRFEKPDAVEPFVEVPPDTPALITFTTGSTGTPKAAVRTHKFLAAQHAAIVGQFGDYHGKIDMPVLPIFVFINLALGITSVLPKKKPDQVYAQILHENVDSSSGSPAFYEKLARWCNVRGLKLPLKRLYTGGAPVFPTLAKLLSETVEGEVVVVYGSTEAEPISHIEAKQMLQVMATEAESGILVGKPTGIDLKIDSPIHGVGEIMVRGAHVLRGAADAEWHHTGDAGKLDGEGRLWLFGRIKEGIHRDGRLWWSGEVERKALDVPGVHFAACLGVPDKALGQKLILFLEGKNLSKPKHWEAEIRNNLSQFPVDEIRVVNRIPRDPRHASKKNIEELKRRFL